MASDRASKGWCACQVVFLTKRISRGTIVSKLRAQTTAGAMMRRKVAGCASLSSGTCGVASMCYKASIAATTSQSAELTRTAHLLGRGGSVFTTPPPASHSVSAWRLPLRLSSDVRSCDSIIVGYCLGWPHTRALRVGSFASRYQRNSDPDPTRACRPKLPPSARTCPPTHQPRLL